MPVEVSFCKSYLDTEDLSRDSVSIEALLRDLAPKEVTYGL